MRIVLDTNVYISAALTGGFAEDIIRVAATTYQLTAVISEEILTELQQKLQDKFNWSSENVDRFLTRIRKIAEIVEIDIKINNITRDPDDNKILECAIAGNADLIVSSDQDLIKLKNFKGIGIIHPKTLSWTFPDYFKKRKLPT